MRKFFCNYNKLTEKYELSYTNSISFNNKTLIQTKNNLLSDINKILQEIYNNLILLKEKHNEENILKLIDESELLLANIYYSLFSSPLELAPQNNQNLTSKQILVILIEKCGKLIEIIEIPEYNKACLILKNHLETILNIISNP